MATGPGSSQGEAGGLDAQSARRDDGDLADGNAVAADPVSSTRHDDDQDRDRDRDRDEQDLSSPTKNLSDDELDSAKPNVTESQGGDDQQGEGKSQQAFDPQDSSDPPLGSDTQQRGTSNVGGQARDDDLAGSAPADRDNPLDGGQREPSSQTGRDGDDASSSLRDGPAGQPAEGSSLSDDEMDAAAKQPGDKNGAISRPASP